MITGIVLALELFWGCSDPEGSDSVAVYADRIRGIERIDLAEMVITKTGSIDDIRLTDANGLMETASALISSIKPGTRKGVYSYDTYLRAYIDLSQITAGDIEIDRDSRRMRIMLPAVETAYAGRDPQIREIHSRVTGLRSPIGPLDRAQLKEVMNEALKREIAAAPEYEDDLRRVAMENGRSFVESLFSDAGYTVEIEYRKKIAD